MLETLKTHELCRKPEGYRGVIVVENGAKSGLEDLLRSRYQEGDELRYLYCPVPSKSGALNAALDCIPEDEVFVFFTDDDVYLDELVLCSYHKASTDSGPGEFFGGPVGRAPGSVDVPPWTIGSQPISVTGWLPDVVTDRMVFVGFNWGAFKSDLIEAGCFDPKFGPGSPYGANGQETNMQRRLLDLGCKSRYVPGAIVEHRVPKDSRRVWWLARRRFRGGVHRGMSEYRTSFDVRPSANASDRVQVIKPPAAPSGSNRAKSLLLKRLLSTATWLGFIKGRILKRVSKRKMEPYSVTTDHV